MNVDINTRMIMLLGKPLSQSFAARMQNTAYQAMGLNMIYSYAEVENDHLGDVVAGLRHLPFAGFAVTKPNKVEILKYLDELDPLCEKMGASNTVVLRDGKLIGYNTDGVGFLVSLQEETDVKLEETVFFCMGAGGAGRAIASILAFNGAKKIYICDKDQSAAESLTHDINTIFAPVAELVDFASETNKEAAIRSSEFLINACGLGMRGCEAHTPFDKEILSPEQYCFDATYNPPKTRFLEEAESVGCRIMNGLGMSLHQGAVQIKLWSGQDAPIDVMRQELFAIMNESEK